MDPIDLDQIERDQKLIADLGGPSKVAELLNFPKAGGQQRVQNWLSRGIPPSIKVKWPDIFMRELPFVQQPRAQEATNFVAEKSGGIVADTQPLINADAPLTVDPVLEAELDKAAQAGLVKLPKKAPVWDGLERRKAPVQRRIVDRAKGL